jgi:hypothetical protein
VITHGAKKTRHPYILLHNGKTGSEGAMTRVERVNDFTGVKGWTQPDAHKLVAYGRNRKR